MNKPSIQKPNTSFALVLILIVTAFAGGLLIGRGGFLNSVAVSPSSTSANEAFDMDYISQIYNKVKSDYLGDTPNKETVTHSLAKGLIESLNDPYSAYLNPKDAQEYLKTADSAYDGIGVQLGYNDQYTTVQTVMDGFPGQKAGLKSGDLIVSIDGADMSKVRPELVSGKIKGVAGTSVKLGIYRESEGKVLSFDIVRAQIKLDNITFEKLENGVVQIHINRFTEGSKNGQSGAQVFDDIWDNVVTQVAALSPKGIILDLRNNPGGYVDAVRHVAEEFLSDGQVMMKEQQKGHDEIVYRDNRQGKLESLPLVVLVNEGSASASEIFAGAIHDNKRGSVIGMKTIGKGVEQELLTLEDNSLLLLVFRKWLTPDGRQINKENPITPDELIEYKAPEAEGKPDSQEKRALEIIAAQK